MVKTLNFQAKKIVEEFKKKASLRNEHLFFKLIIIKKSDLIPQETPFQKFGTSLHAKKCCIQKNTTAKIEGLLTGIHMLRKLKNISKGVNANKTFFLKPLHKASNQKSNQLQKAISISRLLADQLKVKTNKLTALQITNLTFK